MAPGIFNDTENAHIMSSGKSLKKKKQTLTPNDFVKNKNKNKSLEGTISKC